MNIIGISAYYHDSACCLLKNGSLVAAALEERFTRIKHDAALPVNAFNFCLTRAGLSICEIDCVAYYENPKDKLARQLWAGLPDITGSTSDMFDRLNPLRVESDIKTVLGYEGKIMYFPHHMSHAAGAFFYSGFRTAAILVVDGVGEWSTTSYGTGRGKTIELSESVEFPDSLGLFYSAITSYLGFRVNDGEYKMMGLAPYGEPRYTEKIRQLIASDVKGQYQLDQNYFKFTGQGKMFNPLLIDLLGRPPREADSKFEQFHQDVACSAQKVLVEVLLDKVDYLYNETGLKNLCMTGGVALNCAANGIIRRKSRFENIFVPPAPGDDGCAIGAATLAYHRVNKEFHTPKRIEHVFLGPYYDASEIRHTLNTIKLPWKRFKRIDELHTEIAALLANGKIVGWFNGAMEFGARALGARSILADPRNHQMRDRVNIAVKKREKFRPFSPVILETHAKDHFEIDQPAPFMVETCRVISDITLDAVTHVDGSARVQTVGHNTNAALSGILQAFLRITGCPILLNTSFNLRGEPIVCSPEDAIACFVRSGMDVLILEEFVIDRNDLPDGYMEGVNDFYELVDLARRIKVNQAAYTLI